MSVSSATAGGSVVARRRLLAAAGHSLALSAACLTTYWLTAHVLSGVGSLSAADDLLGGLWAVIATVFVYRETHRQNVTAALSRACATLPSFALCLAYLLFFSFHLVGLAVLIGLGTFVLMELGRDDDVVTAGITPAVVMVVAAANPHDAWEQPILRVFDTALGIAVGVAASWIGLRLAAPPAAGRASTSSTRIGQTLQVDKHNPERQGP